MDIKDKKVTAFYALEMARLALQSVWVCAGTKCTECPFYTDKGECISVVIYELANKAEKRVYSEK